MFRHKIFVFLFAFIPLFWEGGAQISAQTPPEIARFLSGKGFEGATLACEVRDLSSGKQICSYQSGMQVAPASVMKLITTATALEILGSDYRFPTTLAYDGEILDGTLRGNLYIIGSGDPTLGSSHFAPQSREFLNVWVKAVRDAGIRHIEGSVIADESVFDTEGISPKWVYEDLGSYYGAGSYGLSVFDNSYRLSLRTTAPGTRPQLLGTNPPGAVACFHNYLKAASVRTDSCYIMGAPFSGERFLYGVIPAGKATYTIKGDLPDPPLFLARFVAGELERQGVSIARPATCYRLLKEAGAWNAGERTELITTYSPPLARIVEVTNHKSHNLFADALLKAVGLRCESCDGASLSSFGKGIRVVKSFWKKKGLPTEGLHLYDGSGLSPTDRTTADFVVGLLTYMATQSPEKEAFRRSLPRAGEEGSVRNFLKGSHLQGKARLKSGSMSRVRGYAGYVEKDGKRYALAIFLNNYNADGSPTAKALARLVETWFP